MLKDVERGLAKVTLLLRPLICSGVFFVRMYCARGKAASGGPAVAVDCNFYFNWVMKKILCERGSETLRASAEPAIDLFL